MEASARPKMKFLVLLIIETEEMVMIKNRKWITVNHLQLEGLFYISLAVLGLAAFLFFGGSEYVLFDDSQSYMRIKRVEGVMPIYPFFLLFNQYLFGLDRYLNAVILEQTLFAAMCLILFTKVIRDEFDLKYWESYLVFFLLLLPFTTEMPQSMATQHILTEGLSYSFFYLFMIILLKAVWTKKFTWFAGSVGMAVILAMLRSQLQILFGVCGVIFFYVVCSRKAHGKEACLLIRAIVGVIGCLCICFFGISAISRITAKYMDTIRTNEKFSLSVMKIQAPEAYEEYVLSQADEKSDASEEAVMEEDTAEETQEIPVEELAGKSFTTSQYVSLIFSRGMYEADREDIELFEDDVIKGLYEELYEAVDAKGERYIYAKNGLWMWRDIVGGIGQVGKTCLMIPSAYYAANYPELVLSDHFSETRNKHLVLVGVTLIKAHFGRFLYHTLMLLPQAFICTVFFQIAPIYLLCHLVTLFLYLSALVLMIWGYADKKADNKYAEFMAVVLGSNVVMVVIISLVFFGQQRYLVYNFGIFYIAYYLLLRSLWKCHIRDRLMGRFLKK